MKIRCNEKVHIMTDATTEDVVQAIQALLGTRHYFSHLIIDGKEVPQLTDTMDLTTVEDIEVIAITAQAFITDLLTSITDYLQHALPNLAVVTEHFTQGTANADQWQGLSDLFESAQWLHQANDVITASEVCPPAWHESQAPLNRLTASLPLFEAPLREENQQQIAELLRVNVTPAFEQLLQVAKSSIPARHHN